MTWTPRNDFEEEVIALQPEHNFIFGALSQRNPDSFFPRPKAQFDNLETRKGEKNVANLKKSDNEKLRMISTIQKIAHTKPLGEQATINDWDNNDKMEQETIAMMRYCGLGPGLDRPLFPNVSMATVPIENDWYVMENGNKRLPIILDEKYFEPKNHTHGPSLFLDGHLPRTSNNSESPKKRIDNSATNDSDKSTTNSSHKSVTNYGDKSPKKCSDNSAGNYSDNSATNDSDKSITNSSHKSVTNYGDKSTQSSHSSFSNSGLDILTAKVHSYKNLLSDSESSYLISSEGNSMYYTASSKNSSDNFVTSRSWYNSNTQKGNKKNKKKNKQAETDPFPKLPTFTPKQIYMKKRNSSCPM